MTVLPTYPLDGFHLEPEPVILKSSDGVEFKVYTNILALASPHFNTMFDHPQPSESKDGEPSEIIAEDPTGVQVIELPELGTTLDHLLRLVYPIPPPTFPGMSESGELTNSGEFVKALEPVLAAALKYEIKLVFEKVCASLLDAAEKTCPDGRVIHDTLAVRVYTIACQYRLKEIARRAAHVSLKGRIIGVFFEDFRKINAAQYFALVNFHRKMVSTMENAVEKGGGWASSYVKCRSCGRIAGYEENVAAWWLNWSDRARPIIVESPASEEIFSAGFLSDMYLKAKVCHSVQCSHISEKWDAIPKLIKEKMNEAIEKARCTSLDLVCCNNMHFRRTLISVRSNSILRACCRESV
ncbi:hypothetical protein ACEPAH_3802 [Sanghuangporus vaninii]